MGRLISFVTQPGPEFYVVGQPNGSSRLHIAKGCSLSYI